MLLALHNAMVDTLANLDASDETIAGYKQRWRDTLEGKTRSFPCPACFMAGVEHSALKALPAKANSDRFYVKCLTCEVEYSYTDEAP